MNNEDKIFTSNSKDNNDITINFKHTAKEKNMKSKKTKNNTKSRY